MFLKFMSDMYDDLNYVSQIHTKALYLRVLLFEYTTILTAKGNKNRNHGAPLFIFIELQRSIMELHKILAQINVSNTHLLMPLLHG